VLTASIIWRLQVGNANNYTVTDWQAEIDLAVAAHIDAFALNIAFGDSTVPSSVANAFSAVTGKNFKLFFSFDYAGGVAPWPKNDVMTYATQYFGNAGYYKTAGRPFVSTFEGPGSAADWKSIKAQTGCFFMPDWSSAGANSALQLAGGGIVDGLFSWAGWPWGNRNMDTYV
jgi:Glycosyl hydrolase family 71